MSKNPNIDQNEINQFSQHADKWWDLNGPYKALHQINPIRLTFIQQFANLESASCLDIGCGGGLVTEGLAKHGANVNAIDMDPHAIATAKTHAIENQLTINYQMATAEQLAVDSPEKFDLITCLEMLEHVPEPESIIHACSKLCKPQGIVIFSTLNRNPLAYMGAIVAAEYVLNIVPKGTHQYQRFIKPSELSNWARAEGLELLKQNGIHYNPLTGTGKLTQQTPINYITAYQKS